MRVCEHGGARATAFAQTALIKYLNQSEKSNNFARSVYARGKKHSEVCALPKVVQSYIFFVNLSLTAELHVFLCE